MDEEIGTVGEANAFFDELEENHHTAQRSPLQLAVCDVKKLVVGAPPMLIPRKTFSMLLPHQKVGAEWMWKRVHPNIDTANVHAGCILADHMGLGKTARYCAADGIYRWRYGHGDREGCNG